ncbi:MAG: glycosyltransferase family 4 protein [Gammaproteobacteria bacterium]|nr:glycosyltransferase family 4 protein [Gammaproteobacteria bacterium]MDH3507532.1 glycosyltransferase family 4 protein [Gammaproteobacteria bacterium]
MSRNADVSEPTTVWVNARFLERPVTGVERVARELLGVIATQHLDDDGYWFDGNRRFRFRLIAPAATSMLSPWQNLRLERAGVLNGHAWEQLDLPLRTRGDWLVSLCNTGPLLKRRHILFLHDAQPFVIPDNFSLAFRLWYRLLFNVAGRSSRHILVNSFFTRRELYRHVGLRTEKMTLCYPGSEHACSDEVGASEPLRFDLPEQPFLLAVASANPNKNFDAVVRALHVLGATAPPCVIVGRTDQRQFGNVIFDSERVTHLGYVSDEDLLALYRQALCLVFPSFYEGFGLPPLEAMAAGCPVITSRSSAMPEICGTAAEYCDPRDYRSLAGAIRRVSESAARRTAMIESGLLRARMFSWRMSGQRVLELIANTATTNRRVAATERAGKSERRLHVTDAPSLPGSHTWSGRERLDLPPVPPEPASVGRARVALSALRRRGV